MFSSETSVEPYLCSAMVVEVFALFIFNKDCDIVDSLPLKIRLRSQSLVPQNVTSFGNSVCADVIS